MEIILKVIMVIGFILSVFMFAILGIVAKGYTSYGDVTGFTWKINQKQKYVMIPLVISLLIICLLLLN